MDREKTAVPTYVIGQLDIQDPDAYEEYLSGFLPSFQRHGGELLATSKSKDRNP